MESLLFENNIKPIDAIGKIFDPQIHEAVSMIVNGFCKDVFKQLPMEFAVEATKLMEVSLEGSVG